MPVQISIIAITIVHGMKEVGGGGAIPLGSTSQVIEMNLRGSLTGMITVPRRQSAHHMRLSPGPGLRLQAWLLGRPVDRASTVLPADRST